MPQRYRFGSFLLNPASGQLSREGAPIALQPLTYDLLRLFLQQPGVLLSREDLLAALWPDTYVSDASLSQAIRRLRNALAGEDLVETVPRRGYRFVATVVSDDTPDADTPPRTTNLTAPHDAFVGRAELLAELEELLAGADRLVTLLGPGGVGKTRLAKTVAGRAQGGLEALWFIDLSAATDTDDLVGAVVRTLDLPGVGALSRLPPSLLIFDNAEGLGAAAGPVLLSWLEAAPDLRFLVTSRTVLGLPAERVVVVPPLSTDDGIALWCARSGGDDSDPALPELVAALDGLPLAIELAAHRSRVLSTSRLLQFLEQRFQLLRTEGASGRHGSLRASLDASWSPLEPDHRAGLTELCCFVGAFSIEDVAAVLDPERDALGLLQALVDRSWVQSAPEADRFRLLEMVREYVVAHADPMVLAAAEVRHGRLWTLGSHFHTTARRQPEGPHIAHLRAGFGDLVAACRRGITRGDADVVVDTLDAMWVVQRRSGQTTPVLELAEAALPVLTGRHRFLVLMILVKVAQAHHGFPRSLTLLEEAHRVAGQLDDTDGMALTQLHRAMALRRLGRLDEAFEDALAALDRFATPDAAHNRGVALTTLTAITASRGQPHEALAYSEQALALHRTGSVTEQSAALVNFGIQLGFLGRHEDAMAAYQEALDLDIRSGDRRRQANVRGCIAVSLAMAGDLPGAIEQMEAALTTFHSQGLLYNEAQQLNNLGRALVGCARLDEARARFHQALEVASLDKNAVLEGTAHLGLATVHAALDRPADAHEAVERALTLFEAGRSLREAAAALRVRAGLHLAAGALEAAAADIARAEALARETWDRFELVYILCVRARLCHATGDPDGALAATDEARGIIVEAGWAGNEELQNALTAARRGV